jgi:hypothetical protein
MSIADPPISAPSHWYWLANIYAVRILLVVLLIRGLLSFAAVLELGCRNEETFLTSETGALLTDEHGQFLVTGQKQKRCWLADSVE